MIICPLVNVLEYVLDAFKPDMLQNKLLATTKEHGVRTFQHSKSKIQSQIKQIRVSLRWLSLLCDFYAETKEENGRIYTKCDKRTKSKDISYLDFI